MYTGKCVDLKTGEATFLSVEEYMDIHKESRELIKMTCDKCGQELHIVAENASLRSAHFAHPKNSKPCEGKQVGLNLFRDFSGEHGERPEGEVALMKARFASQWEWHYSELCRLVPELDYEEFKLMLDASIAYKFWENKYVNDADLPYLMATSIHFSPGNKRGRRSHVILRFEPQKDRKGKYWIVVREQRQLRRYILDGYRRGEIVTIPKDMRGERIVEGDCRGKTVSSEIHSSVRRSVKEWLSRHRHFVPNQLEIEYEGDWLEEEKLLLPVWVKRQRRSDPLSKFKIGEREFEVEPSGDTVWAQRLIVRKLK
jgi:hypothetical protein